MKQKKKRKKKDEYLAQVQFDVPIAQRITSTSKHNNATILERFPVTYPEQHPLPEEKLKKKSQLVLRKHNTKTKKKKIEYLVPL